MRNLRLLTGRRTAIAALTVAMATTSAVAYAVWSERSQSQTPDFPIGTVAFGAAPTLTGTEVTELSEFSMSTGGAPVTVSVPGKTIAQVLEQKELDSPPVFWTFTTAGMSPESVGVAFSLAVLGQGSDATELATPAADGSGAWDGHGSKDTLLGYSTLQIYPAAGTVDAPQCTEVPDLPAGFGTYQDPNPDAPNVYVYGPTADAATVSVGSTETEAGYGEPIVVSPTGQAELADHPTLQVWCVAIKFINAPDLPYTQQAWVTGDADDQNSYTAYQSWGAEIAYPPSLPMLGYYVASFSAVGDGCAAVLVEGGNPAACSAWSDQMQATDSESWYAQIYPDPTKEPDVVIQLDPTVVHIDPGLSDPSDVHPAPSAYYLG